LLIQIIYKYVNRISRIAIFKGENVSLILEDNIVKDFHANITAMSKSTAEQYLSRLNIFGIFCRKNSMT